MTRPFPANSFQPSSQGTLIPPQICICICITFCICICLMLTSICVRFYKPTMHTRRSRNEPDPFKERFNPFVNPFEQHIYTFLTMFTHFVKMPGHTRGNCESRRLLSVTEGGARKLESSDWNDCYPPTVCNGIYATRNKKHYAFFGDRLIKCFFQTKHTKICNLKGSLIHFMNLSD